MFKNKDNRMQWILEVEEIKLNPDGKKYFTDYEICSEVRIPGVLEYENGSISCGLYQEADRDGLYTYLLRICHLEKEYKFDNSNYSKEGYYFDEGLVGELLSIFSFYFQARFYLKATIQGELTAKSMRWRIENDFVYKKANKLQNFEMFTGKDRNWATENGIKKFLDNIRSLHSDYHQCLIRSFYWYRQAIKEIGGDRQLFFIRMVSAVESILTYIEAESDNLEIKLTSLSNNFTNDENIAIADWLSNRKIKQRFNKFFILYSKGFFKGGKRKASHCYIKKSDLSNFTSRIYKARSAYLHEGKPMYLSFDLRMDEAKYWDVDPSQGMMVDRKKFGANEKLPRLRWFERIVNYCIKKFIEEKYE